MRNLKRALVVLFILALAVLVLFFVLENQQATALMLFGWATPEVPVALLVLAALLVGLAVGPLLGGYIAVRARRRVRKVAL